MAGARRSHFGGEALPKWSWRNQPSNEELSAKALHGAADIPGNMRLNS
jgi:hypothetical protein